MLHMHVCTQMPASACEFPCKCPRTKQPDYSVHLHLLLQDYHDDGEGGAGIKLMYLLQDSNVKNVMVVVSRWFGGIMLGQARFMYITDAARGVLDQGGYLQKALPKAVNNPGTDLQPMEESSSSEEEEVSCLLECCAVILPEAIDKLEIILLCWASAPVQCSCVLLCSSVINECRLVTDLPIKRSWIGNCVTYLQLLCRL